MPNFFPKIIVLVTSFLTIFAVEAVAKTKMLEAKGSPLTLFIQNFVEGFTDELIRLNTQKEVFIPAGPNPQLENVDVWVLVVEDWEELSFLTPALKKDFSRILQSAPPGGGKLVFPRASDGRLHAVLIGVVDSLDEYNKSGAACRNAVLLFFALSDTLDNQDVDQLQRRCEVVAPRK